MKSVLNPEAPEFHPNFNQNVQVGYLRVNKTIKAANNFPRGASYDLFKTFIDFNIVTCQLSENVVLQSNQIMVTEVPGLKLKCDDNEFNTEKIIDVNDSILNRIHTNIDAVEGVNEKSELVEKNIAPWNHTPVITKIKVGSTTLIGAKNVPRPQINFKDPIDNSETLWVPKLMYKPNNIKPLALNILYDDDGIAVGYEHPYQVELELYCPPEEFLGPDPVPPSFPPSLTFTPYTYVDTEEKMDQLVDHLNNVSEIAVDVEHHSYRTFQGITCLIQITTCEGGDFIIDALAIREHIHKLNWSFTDPRKIKVFHGADSDVIWLQRDFGVYIVGLFDTHQAAIALKLNERSLKSILMKYCNIKVDKSHQLADWRIRPLPEEFIEYARSDTHYLLYIWRQMKRELLESNAGQIGNLCSVFENSKQICLSTYKKEVLHEESHMPLYVRSKKNFNTQQMSALKMLYKWRDQEARKYDESPMYILPNHMLLNLAEILPREVQGVNALCNPMPPFLKQNLITVHRMILSCRELPMEPPLYHVPTTVRTMNNIKTKTAQKIHYSIHDYTAFIDNEEEIPLCMDNWFIDQWQEASYRPQVSVFVPNSQIEVVSDLNADAKMFFPPYERYRAYRILAQVEEAREFREKEAKIAAISKGNELIKAEVINKLLEAKSHIDNNEVELTPKVEINGKSEPAGHVSDDESKNVPNQGHQYQKKDTAQRKRKIIEKSENNTSERTKEIKQKDVAAKSDVKDGIYKNINYKKFYNEASDIRHPSKKNTKK